MLFVGIDWADDHHDVCLVEEGHQETCSYKERFRIAHSVEGFEMLFSKLALSEAQPAQVLVALETSQGLLVHALLQQGYAVYAIPPKAVNRYKDRHASSSAKDDKRDALAMAHLLRTDRHLFAPLHLLPEEYRLLSALCDDLRQMVADRTRLINRLIACLKEYYPTPLDLFGKWDSAIALAFLRAFPDPAALEAASQKRFTALFRKERYSCPGRVPDLYQASRAKSLRADPSTEKAARMRMLALVDQLGALRAHIQAYESQIQKLFESLDAHQNLPTLPGVGERLAPELAAALGPPDQNGVTRFASSRALGKLAGCAPVTKQSGNYKHVAFRRACDKRLRRTLHDWAQASLRTSRWARAFYDYYKARGARHNTLLRNLAGKLLAILFRLWRSGEDYDEHRHIDQLRKHNVVWAMAL
jgi:transposase